MTTTYDVRIYKTEVYKGKRGNVHYVRWLVGGKQRKQPYKNAAQAESFRADLVSAARKGEAFDMDSGLPVSMERAIRVMTWYDFACTYVDMKWPRVAATTRRTHAEAFTALTVLMLAGDRGKPDAKTLRAALCRWAFNTVQRDAERCPAEVRAALKWAAGHTRPVSALAKPDVLRTVLDGLTVRLDGKPAAPSVVSRRRKILNAAVEYAVELKLLGSNPIPALKWAAPKTVHTVDRRSVANPTQARSLLNAVRDQGRTGLRLVAFFGCLYYAAMRPEEAVSLGKHNLALPPEGWGEFHLDTAEPHAGKEWTDSGANRDRRQLKQRARGETRTVPCPPELTALIWEHVERFGYGPGGRLFVGERNGEELPKGTIVRAWRQARRDVFTPEVAASPLAATPYDLRHAAVSTWLNGGVPPTQVAEWAGHSVEILLKIYAKCLDGGSEVLRQRIQEALGHRPTRPGPKPANRVDPAE
jgi:integrase